MNEADRHSKAVEVELVTDPTEKAKQEAKNALRQFDEVIEQIEYWCQPERPFKLRPSAILGLHRKALEGIHPFAGAWRTTPVEIVGSGHTPPPFTVVPEFVERMCDYVNDNWSKSALHLSAYVLWRMNWIHPFADGNGRTARAVSYVLLCVRLGYRLPGTDTIPDQISRNKPPYYAALEAADRRATNNVDIVEMEKFLEGLLAGQLLSVVKAAGSPNETLS